MGAERHQHKIPIRKQNTQKNVPNVLVLVHVACVMGKVHITLYILAIQNVRLAMVMGDVQCAKARELMVVCGINHYVHKQLT